MLRGTAEFEQAILGSHTRDVKAEAWIAGRRVAADLPLVSSSVSGTSDDFVRRTTSMTFKENLSTGTEALGKTLARPGCEVRIWSGVKLGTRTLWLPVHWGTAETPSWSWPERTVTLSSPDVAMRVSLDRFRTPRSSSVGMTVAQQIEALVRETLPRVRFVDESGDGTAVSRVVWDQDRNNAITKLASSIGCETYLRPDGSWVLRRVSSVLGVAAHWVREGRSLVRADVEYDWSAVRNSWVARSERADGAMFIGFDEDDDPDSPTWVDGPLRRRTAYADSSLYTTNAQCTAAARAHRYRNQGARVTVKYEGLLHPGVEAGDRHDVVVDGTTHRIILDSFEFDPAAATMTGHGRTAYATDLEGVT